MDYEAIGGRVRAFHQRHGAECYPHDGFFWYADGASRDINPIGLLADPPNADTDRGAYDLAVNKLCFGKAKLRAKTAEFDELKESLTFGRPNDGGASELNRLKELRSIVQAADKDVRKAEAALRATRLGRQQQAAVEWRQQETIRLQEWRAKLEECRI